MDFRKLGLLAACLASTVSALNHGIRDREAPARATNAVELAEKSVDGVSPVPTSRPELAEMELFKRADYSLPPNYCGWYGEYNSASYTCALRAASCINVGDYRGCCNGPTLSCASTFFSSCIPSSSLTESQSCGKSTICCSNTNFPECGTILFSSSANTLHTYTNIDCYSAGFGSTYAMQDYPPVTETTTSTSTSSSSSSSSTTTTTSSSSSTTTTPAPTPTGDPSPTPIGPIVGGTVGGVAVLGIIALSIILVVRRNHNNNSSDPSHPSQQPPPPVGGGGGPTPSTFPPPHHQQQMTQTQTQQPHHIPSPTSPAVPPAYDPRYSYAGGQGQGHGLPHQAGPYSSPDPNDGTGFGSYGGGHPSPPIPSPSPVKSAGGPGGGGASPVQVVVNEAPATNPRGIGDNRAELA